IKIGDLLTAIECKYGIIIVDCLTLWLSNVMTAGLDAGNEIENLVASLASLRSARLYIVSNEVGAGIVPDNELARRFRDAAGILNQKVASISDEVYMTVAGIPIKIKGEDR
ncbi:MAG: bifunctional adenosylcobinamide kinase/adenosylcobinamide-phosphate guanylyltransferase, partial [Syntrophales bacterium]|nr:bifunctional adenosylcobinamide kinase/adenosylcobinamide-phosphate guanylyltransferase [Syntrophales bacterium]